jgi:hypothetical protein
LIAIIVVIVNPVLDNGLNLREGLTTCQIYFIFHMTIEAFLRGIVPAVSPSGHRAPEIGIGYDLNEFIAGIVAALVAVNQRF